MGMRLTIDKQSEYARELLPQLAAEIGETLVDELLSADMSDEAGIQAQRERVAVLKSKLADLENPKAKDLLSLADVLVKKSVWIFGGDGWAYDIGYGGLDHVLASGRNVNVLLLDTGVYSNTGGQMSKATPRAAVAKFAAAGKNLPKKDLGMITITYGNVYVAQVAMGANMTQTVKAFQEAEAYDGPSLIIAYSHCIAHGFDLAKGGDVQKDAVNSGFWPLYRFNPAEEPGKNPLHLDSRAPSEDVADFMYKQNRFRVLRQANPKRASDLLEAIRDDVQDRWEMYQTLAGAK
jgi:pyruvate-ferredoxin/flavodoxin oxidoreductase